MASKVQKIMTQPIVRRRHRSNIHTRRAHALALSRLRPPLRARDCAASSPGSQRVLTCAPARACAACRASLADRAEPHLPLLAKRLPLALAPSASASMPAVPCLAADARRKNVRGPPSRSQKTRIQVWLFENTDLRIEGKIIGFDEYMNLVVRATPLLLCASAL